MKQYTRNLTRDQRHACLRLITITTPQQARDSVELWDQRTSSNDARAAVSIAMGADPNSLHPATGVAAYDTHKEKP